MYHNVTLPFVIKLLLWIALIYLRMNKFLLISIAFMVSIGIHFIFFDRVQKNLENKTLQFPTTNKKQNNNKTGYSKIKFVKLVKKEPPKVTKTKQNNNKKTKKIIKKLEKPQKPITKKQKVLKKKQVAIKKKVKTINLPRENKVNLKTLFTKKEKTVEEKKQEKLKEALEEKNKEINEINNLDPLTQQYIKLYGEKYFAFSKEEKRFIKSNISSIGKITQSYLEYPFISIRTKQQGINIIEFTLHPNGDISNLNLLDSSHYTALDENSIDTIKEAYKDYPKPNIPVKIIINIKYVLY